MLKIKTKSNSFTILPIDTSVPARVTILPEISFKYRQVESPFKINQPKFVTAIQKQNGLCSCFWGEGHRD
jgi:hypothetical protein